jgi:hypothetical protein
VQLLFWIQEIQRSDFSETAENIKQFPYLESEYSGF